MSLRSSCFSKWALAAQLFSTCVLVRLCLYGRFCKTLLLKSCSVPKEDVCRCGGRTPLGQNPEGGRKEVVPCVRDVPSGLVSRNHRSGGVVVADANLAWFGSQGAVVGEEMPSSHQLLGGICLLAVSSKAGTGPWVLEGHGDPNAPIPSLVQPMGESLGVRWALPKQWPDSTEVPRTTSGFDENQEQFVWD